MGRRPNPNRFPDDAHDLMVNREEFESKYSIEPNASCWLWTGMLHRQGYGFIPALRKQDQKIIMATAHRISYRLFRGPIVLPNVNHTCHTPGCVNPDHLYNGTQKDNVDDIWAAGRMPKTKAYAKRPNRKPKNIRPPRVPCDRIVRQLNRKYKYSEEDIQFGRTQSLTEIQQRFGVDRKRASAMKYEFHRLYRWLPWPPNSQ
jgi:hypothetical protein